MPDEGLLTVDHGAVGKLTEKIRGNHEESRRHESRRRCVLPSVRVVAGCLDEVGDVLETDPERVRAEAAIYQLGRIHEEDGTLPRRTNSKALRIVIDSRRPPTESVTIPERG